mmetsp:Transcript_40840/g.98497  ORF Transcript_40840/g.98497 Transcript_40840/m.98497 type:complete len:90 (-) Transcript_40840:978-1247(-)
MESSFLVLVWGLIRIPPSVPSTNWRTPVWTHSPITSVPRAAKKYNPTIHSFMRLIRPFLLLDDWWRSLHRIRDAVPPMDEAADRISVAR